MLLPRATTGRAAAQATEASLAGVTAAFLCGAGMRFLLRAALWLDDVPAYLIAFVYALAIGVIAGLAIADPPRRRRWLGAALIVTGLAVAAGFTCMLRAWPAGGWPRQRPELWTATALGAASLVAGAWAALDPRGAKRLE
jgi:hypothetical protein